MSSAGSSLTSELGSVYHAFMSSPQIRLAVETWQTSVLEAGVEGKSDADTAQIRYLLLDVIRQIVLAGFAVIVDGVVDSSATITWDSEEKAWVADVDEDVEATLCIFMPPARLKDRVLLSSYGASAFRVWEKLDHIERNMMARDSLNSSRSVYTVVNPNMTPGDALTPSFLAPRSNPSGAADADYTTSIRRHELLRELARHTDSVREDDMESQMVAGGGFPIDSRVKRHEENFVTDGMAIGNEARHLNGPVSDMNRLLRTYDHDLLMAAGVPPQKLGMNVNSERLAGSELISSQAIRSFDARVREIRVVINQMLAPLGVEVRPSVPYSILVQHAAMFKPEVHRELMSSTLGIPAEYLVDGEMDVTEADATKPDAGISEMQVEENEDVGGPV